jgi:DNA-binding transcriptional regulator YhcF (GntR family)
VSFDVLRWAFERRCGSAPAKLVLLKLADNANDAGLCWPSLGYLAQETELSKNSIKRALRELTKRGLVRKLARYNGALQQSNAYQLNLKIAVDKPVDKVLVTCE